MHAAASMAASASGLGTGIALPSGALPVVTETKPPAWMMRSSALPVDAQVAQDRERPGAPRLDR